MTWYGQCFNTRQLSTVDVNNISSHMTFGWKSSCLYAGLKKIKKKVEENNDHSISTAYSSYFNVIYLEKNYRKFSNKGASPNKGCFLMGTLTQIQRFWPHLSQKRSNLEAENALYFFISLVSHPLPLLENNTVCKLYN